MTTATFDRDAQRREAMTLANETRTAISTLRKQIAGMEMKDGCLLVAAFLTEPSEPAAAIRVFPLLHSIRRMGETKAHNLLDVAEIMNADKRVRHLTARQRKALASALRMKAATL